MNRPPEILVDSGFVTDYNGVLTEMVIPASVATQNAPSIVTTYATAINWIPSNTATLTQFNALKLQELNSSLLAGYSKLTTVNMPELQTITALNVISFNNCSALTVVNMPKLTSISLSGNPNGIFMGCTSLATITLPSLTTISTYTPGANGGTFKGCTGLKTVSLPKIKTITDQGNSYNATFGGCTALESVQLGSEGEPVTSLTGSFYGCTQSGLIITIYTNGGAALSGSPWGATNATIVYEEA